MGNGIRDVLFVNTSRAWSRVSPGRLGHRRTALGKGATVGGRVKEPELSPPLSMHSPTKCPPTVTVAGQRPRLRRWSGVTPACGPSSREIAARGHPIAGNGPAQKSKSGATLGCRKRLPRQDLSARRTPFTQVGLTRACCGFTPPMAISLLRGINTRSIVFPLTRISMDHPMRRQHFRELLQGPAAAHPFPTT